MLHTIVGKRGRGKTSLAAEIVAEKSYDAYWIYDYCGEFSQFAVDESVRVESNSGSFEQFMVDMWDDAGKNESTLVLLDEIAVYGKNNPQIDHLYRLGRHRRIDIIAISQRFYSLPVITRSQTDIYHVFQITESRDVQYLAGVVSRAVLQKIITLGMFEYINLTL